MTDLTQQAAEALKAAVKSRDGKIPGNVPNAVLKHLYFAGYTDIDGYITDDGRAIVKGR